MPLPAKQQYAYSKLINDCNNCNSIIPANRQITLELMLTIITVRTLGSTVSITFKNATCIEHDSRLQQTATEFPSLQRNLRTMLKSKCLTADEKK